MPVRIFGMPSHSCVMPVSIFGMPSYSCVMLVRIFGMPSYSCIMPVKNFGMPSHSCVMPVRNFGTPSHRCVMPVKNIGMLSYSCVMPVRNFRIRSHLASENIDKPLADFENLNKKGGTPIKPSLARCERMHRVAKECLASSRLCWLFFTSLCFHILPHHGWFRLVRWLFPIRLFRVWLLPFGLFFLLFLFQNHPFLSLLTVLLLRLCNRHL